MDKAGIIKPYSEDPLRRMDSKKMFKSKIKNIMRKVSREDFSDPTPMAYKESTKKMDSFKNIELF